MINTRIADSSDSKNIYAWRNDDLTREMSITTDHVDWTGHSKWLASSLSDPNRFLLICESQVSNESVAMVRFDIEDNEAIVSINLSPQMRGRGLANPCLNSAIFKFSNTFPEVVTLNAEIRLVNIPSQRAFESVGFLRVKENKDVLHYELTL
jgi:RimJ/RimL family protein N-acetyltransferase